jgi:hypothetical protein
MNPIPKSNPPNTNRSHCERDTDVQEVILHRRIRSNRAWVTVSHLLGYILQRPFQPAPSTHADDLPSQFPLIVACRRSRPVVGAVILVVSSLGYLFLVLAEFSMLGLGSCYPRRCRLVGVGLISPSWGCACRMRLALLLWGSPCRR